MGYAHSWGWKEALPHPEQFPLWSADVVQLLACYQRNPPPNPWRDEPWFRYRPHLFGLWDPTICGPFGFDGPILRPDFVAFNGNRATENDCESFLIDARTLNECQFSYCKTWGNPYDLLVTAALVRFAHYFPAITIQCGGGAGGLDNVVDLCLLAFGQGYNPLRDASGRSLVDDEGEGDAL